MDNIIIALTLLNPMIWPPGVWFFIAIVLFASIVSDIFTTIVYRSIFPITKTRVLGWFLGTIMLLWVIGQVVISAQQINGGG